MPAPGFVSVMTEEQQQRAEACELAAVLLRARPSIIGGQPTGPVDALDVVNVALFILTGQDPWPPTILARAHDTDGGES